MPFVSITRLRLRSIRFLPAFALYALRSTAQVKKAPGFLDGALLPDRQWTFWTMTVWDSHESMRSYMIAGSHRAAMPHLVHWCDEASVVHWNQSETELPSWSEADSRMRVEGRSSKVKFPSYGHATLSYREPRIATGSPIRPARATNHKSR